MVRDKLATNECQSINKAEKKYLVSFFDVREDYYFSV